MSPSLQGGKFMDNPTRPPPSRGGNSWTIRRDPLPPGKGDSICERSRLHSPSPRWGRDLGGGDLRDWVGAGYGLPEIGP